MGQCLCHLGMRCTQPRPSCLRRCSVLMLTIASRHTQSSTCFRLSSAGRCRQQRRQQRHHRRQRSSNRDRPDEVGGRTKRVGGSLLACVGTIVHRGASRETRTSKQHTWTILPRPRRERRARRQVDRGRGVGRQTDWCKCVRMPVIVLHMGQLCKSMNKTRREKRKGGHHPVSWTSFWRSWIVLLPLCFSALLLLMHQARSLGQKHFSTADHDGDRRSLRVAREAFAPPPQRQRTRWWRPLETRLCLSSF